MANGAGKRSVRPVWLILPLLLMGIALSLYSFRALRSSELEKRNNRFLAFATGHSRMVERGFESRLAEVDSLRRFLEGSQVVDAVEFSRFTERFLAREASDPAIMWIPRVTADEREAFEAAIRSEGPGEGVISETGSGSGLVPASPKDVYYPIRYVAPADKNGMTVGFDLGSDAVHLGAIQKSADTSGQVVAVLPVTEAGGIFRIISPVYRNPDGSALSMPPRFLGVVACSYCWKDVVEEALSRIQSAGLNLTLSDITDTHDRRRLYSHVSSPPEGEGERAAPLSEEPPALSHRQVFSMGDRTLEIVSTPSGLFDGGEILLAPWVLLVVGVSLTTLLAIHLYFYQSRTRMVTELVHRRTRELHESRDRLELVLSGADLGYWDWWIQTGKMTFSQGWVEMIGYTLEELDPHVRTWQRLVHPDDKEMVLEALRSHLEGKSPLFEAEHRLRHREGKYVWVMNRGRVIERDDHGKALRACGTHQDITERKQASQARDLMAAAVEQFGESLVITDRDGRIQYVNAAFEKTSGYTRKEVVGELPYLLAAWDLSGRIFQEITDVIKSGRTWQGVIDGRKKDGTRYYEHATISPVFDWNGNLVNQVCVRHLLSNGADVDQQKQRFEIQKHRMERMESIGRLAGGVAHDLNNLLGPILGYSEMLLRKMDPENEIYSTLRSIHDSGIRARDVVRQLLAFGRKQSLSPKLLDLTLFVKGVSEKLREMLPETIEARFTFGAALMVNADVVKLEQVLVNLADNARDAMPAGGTFEVETSETTVDASQGEGRGGIRMTPGRYAVISVRDTGEGMDGKTLENIFEPFFSTKDNIGNTGLGLAMVYGTVKQHGGYIWADSQSGKGTVFSIYLPLVAESYERADVQTVAVSLGGTETVMVVEDDQSIREMVVAVLRDRGYQVLSTESGRECLDLLAKPGASVAVMLTDLNIPDINGPELYRAVEKKFPGIKVIYMSGHTEEMLAQKGIVLDGASFLQKPFTVIDLALKVRTLLDGAPGGRGDAGARRATDGTQKGDSGPEDHTGGMGGGGSGDLTV